MPTPTGRLRRLLPGLLLPAACPRRPPPATWPSSCAHQPRARATEPRCRSNLGREIRLAPRARRATCICICILLSRATAALAPA